MDTRPLSRDAYRDASEYVNYSGLKDFSVCPRLYYEKYVEKSFADAPQDYFVYGSLVDCLVTTPGELDSRFIRVDRRVNGDKTLSFEQDIAELEALVVSVQTELEAKPQSKALANKLAKAGRDLQAAKDKLATCQSLSAVTQVTGSMWEEAHATARVILNNPMYKQVIADAFPLAIAQLVLCTHVDGKPHHKGQLDFLVCEDQRVWNLWQMWQGGMITSEDLPARFAELKDTGVDTSLTIIDIKTTARLSDFDGYMYAGQLSFYRNMVSVLTGIDRTNIACSLIVGDKRDGIKMAQDYTFASDVLDQAFEKVCHVEAALRYCKETNEWPSAKSLRGREQTCFRCSECRNRPFSVDNSLSSTIVL